MRKLSQRDYGDGQAGNAHSERDDVQQLPFDDGVGAGDAGGPCRGDGDMRELP